MQTFNGTTACYLFKDDTILFIKFSKKWGRIYAPPGGKMDDNETPTECVIREFKEETGLELISPKLKGVSYWSKGDRSGVIFIYTATEFSGEVKESQEGALSWITKEESRKIKQFPMNEIFFDCLFDEEVFEGKFLYDENDRVLPERVISHSLRKI
jgi:8-oxo-dGTP diphosphatase